jgi:hypothetical protein
MPWLQRPEHRLGAHGFGESKAFDDMYAHLRDGNAEYLKALAQNFAQK